MVIMASKLAVLVSTIRDANERNEFFGTFWGTVLLRAVGGVLVPHHATMYWRDVGQLRCQHFWISNAAIVSPCVHMCPSWPIFRIFLINNHKTYGGRAGSKLTLTSCNGPVVVEQRRN
jgi:hypothetical protein